MNKSLGNTQDTELFAREVGRVMGSLIIATFAAPPTDQEAAKETLESFHATTEGAQESGAPQTTLQMYRGAMEAIDAFIRAR